MYGNDTNVAQKGRAAVMRQVSYNNANDAEYSLQEYIIELYSNHNMDRRRTLMKHILKSAMVCCLTDRQRHCMEDYYIKRKSAKEIGSELGISDSGVYKHLNAAKKKLQSFAVLF